MHILCCPHTYSEYTIDILFLTPHCCRSATYDKPRYRDRPPSTPIDCLPGHEPNDGMFHVSSTAVTQWQVDNHIYCWILNSDWKPGLSLPVAPCAQTWNPVARARFQAVEPTSLTLPPNALVRCSARTAVGRTSSTCSLHQPLERPSRANYTRGLDDIRLELVYFMTFESLDLLKDGPMERAGVQKLHEPSLTPILHHNIPSLSHTYLITTLVKINWGYF